MNRTLEQNKENTLQNEGYYIKTLDQQSSMTLISSRPTL